MEKSKAIDLLDNLIGMIEDNQGNDYDTAFRMAIEALKAQLSQEGTTSDLISRQAAIEVIDKALSRTFAEPCGEMILKDAPSAQPEPQEGHWIDKGWDGDWAWQIDGHGNCWRVIECSECGKGVSVESDYCPHCGARMKGDANGKGN